MLPCEPNFSCSVDEEEIWRSHSSERYVILPETRYKISRMRRNFDKFYGERRYGRKMRLDRGAKKKKKEKK